MSDPLDNALSELDRKLKEHDYHWTKGDQIRTAIRLIVFCLREIVKRLPPRP